VQGTRRRCRASPPFAQAWNTAYSHRCTGMAGQKILEDQAQFPITDLDEMKQDRETLMAELRAIPEYRALFDKSFGGKNGSAITFQHVQYAIGVYERTFIANNTRFDRYASGDMSVLDAGESTALSCFSQRRRAARNAMACQISQIRISRLSGCPTLRGCRRTLISQTAAPGRGGGPVGAFKIPTLRNAAIAPPYMHNGSLKTLDEVLDFYSKGGGRGKGLVVPLQDDKIRKYELVPTERADLKAFLNALVDLSGIPVFPNRSPVASNRAANSERLGQ